MRGYYYHYHRPRPSGSDARRRFFGTHDITHAEEIAKSLGQDELSKYRTEWLFLGRIEQRAIIKQISYHDLIEHELYKLFPSLAVNYLLAELRRCIVRGFELPDQNGVILSQWTVGEEHPADWWKPLCNASAEARREDGRKCAQFAPLLGLNLPDEKRLANALVDAARKWKYSSCSFDSDYLQAFDDIVSFYLHYYTRQPTKIQQSRLCKRNKPHFSNQT